MTLLFLPLSWLFSSFFFTYFDCFAQFFYIIYLSAKWQKQKHFYCSYSPPHFMSPKRKKILWIWCTPEIVCRFECERIIILKIFVENADIRTSNISYNIFISQHYCIEQLHLRLRLLSTARSRISLYIIVQHCSCCLYWIVLNYLVSMCCCLSNYHVAIHLC